ncbi:hypothetical protein MMA231_04135 (plasmid) [Asticcacaulis sp. MM231]|uniref:hypothetical protein n=1 Tax=Asticcacaulis sp. MM231 TaxID=3157666 RepID=UPI0032D58781
MFDGQYESSLQGAKNETTVTPPPTSGNTKAALTLQLIVMVCFAVLAWYTSYNVIIDQVARCAPTRDARVATECAPLGNKDAIRARLTVHDVERFAMTPLHDSQDPVFVQHNKARHYYDWYTKWYLVIALVFVASFVALFVGDAVSKLTKPDDDDRADALSGDATGKGHSKQSLTANEKPFLVRMLALFNPSSNLANFSISLSAVSAIAAFAVSEYYKLIDLTVIKSFAPFGTNVISDALWLEDKTLIRVLFDLASLDHKYYFCLFNFLILLISTIPLALGYRLAKNGFLFTRLVTLLKTIVIGSVEVAKRILGKIDEVKAELAGAQDGYARKTADLQGLTRDLDAKEQSLTDLHTQRVACLVRVAHVTDQIKVLEEYQAELKMKCAEIKDKANGGLVNPLRPDQRAALEAAAQALDNSLGNLLTAIDASKTEQADLDSQRVALDDRIRALADEIAGLKGLIGQANAALAKLRDVIARSQAQLDLMTEQLADLQTDEAHHARTSEPLKVIEDKILPGAPLPISPSTKKLLPAWLTYTGVLIVTFLLFVIGNWAVAPELPRLGRPELILSFAGQVFAIINGILALALLANGLMISLSGDAFFRNRDLTGFTRFCMFSGAALVGSLLFWGLPHLVPSWQIKTLSLPDNLGVAQLKCDVSNNDWVPTGAAASSWVFDNDKFVAVNAISQCRLAQTPDLDANYYIVVGTASEEGAAAWNNDLAADRAAMLASMIKGDLGNDAHVYSLNLGKFDPASVDAQIKELNEQLAIESAPQAKEAMELRLTDLSAYQVQKAKVTDLQRQLGQTRDPAAAERLHVQLRDATAYQRKIVVVSGYSHKLADADKARALVVARKTDTLAAKKAVPDYDLAGELSSSVCADVAQAQTFRSLFKIDPSVYATGPLVCSAEGRLPLLPQP